MPFNVCCWVMNSGGLFTLITKCTVGGNPLFHCEDVINQTHQFHPNFLHQLFFKLCSIYSVKNSLVFLILHLTYPTPGLLVYHMSYFHVAILNFCVSSDITHHFRFIHSSLDYVLFIPFEVDLIVLALFISLLRDLSPLVPVAKLSKF